MKLAVAFFLGWIAVAAAAAQVYKCPQPDGRVAYQGVSCPQGKKMELPAPAAPQSDPTTRGSDEAPLAGAAAIDAAFARGEVVVGMSQTRVWYLLGKPERVLSNSGGEATWFYHEPHRTRMVVIKRGRVIYVNVTDQDPSVMAAAEEKKRVLNEASQARARKFLREGMSESEVVERVGRPDSIGEGVIRFNDEHAWQVHRRVTTWTYRRAGDEVGDTIVYIHEKKVVRVQRPD